MPSNVSCRNFRKVLKFNNVFECFLKQIKAIFSGMSYVNFGTKTSILLFNAWLW